MNRQFFLSEKHFLPLSLTFTLCLTLVVLPAQAQSFHSFQRPKKSGGLSAPQQLYWLQNNGQDSTLKVIPPRLISPNISSEVRNNTGQHYLLRSLTDTLAVKKQTPQFFLRQLQDFSKSDANKGSLDPGIFYAPNEKAEPAGIVIKPLQEIDPEMAINPDHKN